MLYEILKSIRNFFPDTEKQIQGHFKVEDGKINPLPDLIDGQYLLIEGSSMNDGVYTTEYDKYIDESFFGTITPLKIPKDFLKLCDEVETYAQDMKANPYKSESFGGYSYTRKDNDSWQSVFATRLNAWRKL